MDDGRAECSKCGESEPYDWCSDSWSGGIWTCKCKSKSDSYNIDKVLEKLESTWKSIKDTK